VHERRLPSRADRRRHSCNSTARPAPRADAGAWLRRLRTIERMLKFIIGVIVGIILVIWLLAQCVGALT
jgi:hypothetical protein